MMLPTEKPDEIRSKYDARLTELENLELERAMADDAPVDSMVDMYLHMMAIYLIQNDLPNAKFLWKRIPENAKKGQSLLGLHRILLALWARDFPGVYVALGSVEWPEPLQPLITDLRALTVLRAQLLLAQSYSDISQEDFCALMAVSPADVVQACTELGWSVKEGRVQPTAQSLPADEVLPSEEHLAKLAEFISFLEC